MEMEPIDIDSACNIVSTAFKRNRTELPPSREQFSIAVSVLHNYGMSHILYEWFLVSVQEDLSNFLVPEFWNRFSSPVPDCFYRFPNAIQYFYEQIQTYFPVMEEVQSVQEQLKSHVQHLNKEAQEAVEGCRMTLRDEVFCYARSLLFANWPIDFRSVLMEFFSQAFIAYQNKFKCVKEEEPSIQCPTCENTPELCSCESHLSTFYDIIQKLYDLEFFQTVVGDIPINIAQDAVKKHIHDRCKGNFEVPLLNGLQLWLEKTVIAWLSSFYAEKHTKNKEKIISDFNERLLHILRNSFAYVRMEQLFDIIIEFPESQPALEDLCEVLETSRLRTRLIVSLKHSLETRLLHQGVNTSDILTAYISAIKALRILDDTGVFLQVVSEPVCKYLRSREDTVRCIIYSLREDSCGELACELMKGVPLKLEDTYQSDEEVDDWENWCPDPVDADPDKTTDSQRSSDIISLLVNIYGSKELFVNEYRSLLADRILTTFSYNTEREIRYLELLKARFGESQLHYCEVMLKDITDSKRLNMHLGSGEVTTYQPGDFPVDAMILSAQFWPAVKEEKLILPDFMWDNLKNFRSAFESLKGNRTLVFKSHLGSVDLKIELKGRTLNITASPIHATILWHFQEKPMWTIFELSSKMQVSPSVIRRKMSMWQNHGVLRETDTDVFVLTEDQRSATLSHMIEEEEESVTASSHDMKEEELQAFWTFITGMLTNMESLPLERIHSMLRMFAVQGSSSYECSIDDMKEFLEKKVRDRQLVYTNGMFRLPKFDS